MHKKLLVCTLMATALIAGCSSEDNSVNPPPPAPVTEPTQPQDPVEPITPAHSSVPPVRELSGYEKGEKAFAACTACHGAAGKGGANPLAPVLAGKDADWIVVQLKAFKSGERTDTKLRVMNAMASRLDEDTMEYIAAYLSAQTTE